MADAPLQLWGTFWHIGMGAKNRMRQHSLQIEAECEVQLRDPDSGHRHFGFYKTWDRAVRRLASLKGSARHLFEIIGHGRPCKPYLDLDGDALPPGLDSIQAVVDRIEDLVARVFQEDYGVTLPPGSCAWLHSGNQAKVSLHLIISTPPPQRAFRSNHQDDPQGAVHLAVRVRQLDPQGVGRLVSLVVYTKDREKPMMSTPQLQGTMLPLTPHVQLQSTVATWFRADQAIEMLQVPARIPRPVLTAQRGFRSIREAMGHCEPQGAEVQSAVMVGRMLDLLHERVHDSVFYAPDDDDVHDPLRGVKFKYKDERGSHWLRCWVTSVGDAFVAGADFPELCLGQLPRDSELWRSNTVHVDMQHLTWPPQSNCGIEGPEHAMNAVNDCDDPPSHSCEQRLDSEIRGWVMGKYEVLSIRSGMGTGKSTLLTKLMQELFHGKTALVITYRQTLACEMGRKLEGLGFVNYLEVEGQMSDRVAFPRVIVQLDSLHRTAPLMGAPRFDVVILDEVESLLHHFGSSTLEAPISLMNIMLATLRTATAVLSMDAFLGSAGVNFFALAGRKQRVIVNHRRVATRKYVFADDENEWQARIVSDLVDHQANVVVVSMSTDAIERLVERVKRDGAVDDGDVLVHTSKSDDDLKVQIMKDVDKLWTDYRLVCYSPTIEAGVDFSVPGHFRSMYVYACRLSTTPLGLVQMTGRVRALGSAEVHCCAPYGLIQPNPCTRRYSVNEARTYVRWMAQELQRLPTSSVTLGGGQASYNEAALVNREDAQAAWLPADGSMLEVLAHHEAATANARLRFFAEVRDLLEDAGHEVVVAERAAERAKGVNTEARSNSVYKIGMLLASSDVESEHDLKQLLSRIYGNRASEADKWRYGRHLYKQAWGLDRIDALFLEEHGTEPQAPKVMQLVRMLYPGLFERSQVTPANGKAVIRAPLINEVLSALGFRSPFDTETVVREELLAVYEARLKGTELFRQYETAARLFRTGARPPPKWDNRTLAEKLGMVLNACGLHMERKRNQSKKSPKPDEYRLSAEAVQEMGELLKLKTRGVKQEAVNAHAAAFLKALPISKYGRLVRPDAAHAVTALRFLETVDE